MSHAPAIPADADLPLRLQAQPRDSGTHAHAPPAHQADALWALLFALLATLLGQPAPLARHPWRYPGLSPSLRTQASDPQAAALSEEPRSIRRLRAWIGWILRGRPGRGMAPSGARPASPHPIRAARAPPGPAGSILNPPPEPPLRRR